VLASFMPEEHEMDQIERIKNGWIINLPLDDVVQYARDGDMDVRRQLLFSLAIRLKFPERFSSNPYPPGASDYMSDVFFEILRGRDPVRLLAAPYLRGRKKDPETEWRRRQAAELVHQLRLDGLGYDESVTSVIAEIERVTGVKRTRSYVEKAFGDHIPKKCRVYPSKNTTKGS